MKYFVYILVSIGSERHYIGHTNNVGRRLAEHNDVSRNSWASRFAPWKVVYSSGYATRAEAMKEEKHLKSFKNKVTLEGYINRE